MFSEQRRNGPGGLKLRDIMSREVIAVEPENSLREVIDVLTAYGITGAPVKSGDRIMGVISKSDIVDFLASTSPIPSLRPQQAEWGEIEREIDELPDDESCVYFRGMWQDSTADVVERFDEPDGPEWDLLAEYNASSVMTRRLVAMPPDATVAEGASRLISEGVHRILIVDQGELCGIVSATDLVNALANSVEAESER
ncbi:MAG: CBS domain-containing protein [Gemmatimonadota bacterium]